MSARKLHCFCGHKYATVVNGAPMCLEHASEVLNNLTWGAAA